MDMFSDFTFSMTAVAEELPKRPTLVKLEEDDDVPLVMFEIIQSLLQLPTKVPEKGLLNVPIGVYSCAARSIVV